MALALHAYLSVTAVGLVIPAIATAQATSTPIAGPLFCITTAPAIESFVYHRPWRCEAAYCLLLIVRVRALVCVCARGMFVFASRGNKQAHTPNNNKRTPNKLNIHMLLNNPQHQS